MKKQTLLTFFALIGFCTLAFAQPSNDECSSPIILTDVFNNCSAVGAYSNVGATPSSYGAPACFGTTQKDVWFAFTAQATDVTITVRGATTQAAGGTLKNPQIALYFGTCGGTISQLVCKSGFGTNIAEGYEGGLFVGSTYLIRIQGAIGQEGTFQLCINNYNPPTAPTSDCPQASILCDKSPFVVQKVTGAGTNNEEMEDAACFSNGSPGLFETNSTWFVWTCAASGTLEFSLTPLNPTDDIDFVVYKLPNGIGNCAGKQIVRCMASGEEPEAYPNPCLGPTGLRQGDSDISEDAGCTNAGDDAWLRPMDMVQGETYALVVNNYSLSGNGFAVEFGGTGQFLGPVADFTTVPQAVCLGTAVQVIDGSTFAIGQIEGWNWGFGADAVPQTATGKGPHTVQFNSPGVHPVVLTLETDLGCRVTDISTVLIYPDVEVDTLIAAPDCNGTANGTIVINNITSGTPPYLYSWNSGPFGSSSMLDNLGVGVYTLVIRDANLCETDFTIDVKERVLTAEAVVQAPLCFGDNNGVITLNITNGKDPIQFNWGNGFIASNTQGGFSEGIYNIQAIDDVLCKGNFNVTVTDNPLLTLTMDTINVSCFGAADGMAQVNPSGGVGNYLYTWSNGATTQKINDLAPGQYDVTLTDRNECAAVSGVFIIEPPDVVVGLVDVLDLLCNGVPEGEIRVDGQGGLAPYTFSADGQIFVPTDTLFGLPAGDYWVTIKDANGCKDSVFASIIQPPPLIVVADPADTLLNLGFTIDVSTLTLPAGRPVDFLWTPSFGLSEVTDAEPTITAISERYYIVKITDEDGCMAFDTVHIRVNKTRPVYFPNIFKPEGAVEYGNDFFTGFSGPAANQINLLRVYDRWGSLIFERKDFPLNEPNLGWDGTNNGEKVQGVFAWYALVGFIDGEELPYEGSITVIR